MTWVYHGCFSHASQKLIKKWQTGENFSGLTPSECAGVALDAGFRWFAMEYPQGYSRVVAAGCGIGGNFAKEGLLDDSRCRQKKVPSNVAANTAGSEPDAVDGASIVAPETSQHTDPAQNVVNNRATLMLGGEQAMAIYVGISDAEDYATFSMELERDLRRQEEHQEQNQNFSQCGHLSVSHTLAQCSVSPAEQVGRTLEHSLLFIIFYIYFIINCPEKNMVLYSTNSTKIKTYIAVVREKMVTY